MGVPDAEGVVGTVRGCGTLGYAVRVVVPGPAFVTIECWIFDSEFLVGGVPLEIRGFGDYAGVW